MLELKNGSDAAKESPCFVTFAVLDLETSNLPYHNFNKVSITELSIYGFAAKELEKKEASPHNEKIAPPKTPRVLHKLTLMLNPLRMVDPGAESITGLNNYILENESPFDENAGNTVLGFLKHLPAPVCLVAHNGLNFDFPIVKQAFAKLNMALPDSMICVDSLRAFHEIDEKRAITITTAPLSTTQDTETLIAASTHKSQFNWRAYNETTPKRPPKTGAPLKRKHSTDTDTINHSTEPVAFKSRRSLFSSNTEVPSTRRLAVKRKFPPRGVYKLDNMYERIFGQSVTSAHHAESDVDAVMKLMLHYGEDFIDYAQVHAMPIAEVMNVGASTNS